MGFKELNGLRYNRPRVIRLFTHNRAIPLEKNYAEKTCIPSIRVDYLPGRWFIGDVFIW